jgi:hypothetical protein
LKSDPEKRSTMKLVLNAADACPKVLTGHLKMGGTNPNGCQINANSFYFTIAGKPVLPVMGEFHFSRYPRQYWEEEILKMKACGINIIATYIFWIHHEEIQGQWDWKGDKDLRYFVQLCAKNDLYVFPRIGPYAHGECRNGGFPDWIWDMPNQRTDDPVYLTYARNLYTEIFKQLKGMMYKDGGPVIGIQVENEYWFGKAGEKHMMTLKNMAIEIGFDVPLYTVTGWKDASIPQDEFIPVWNGYADLPWELHTDKLPPMPEYFFHHVRNNEIMDEELNLKTNGYTVDFSRYPYATCEMGAGIQITYHRRPIVSTDDVCALSMVKLGNGSNLMGYFVFHGGTHPDGIKTTMQEVYGRPYKLEYPVKSYDFQAPIGEFGQIPESYQGFKIMHLFLNDFGHLLAPMISVLPQERPENVNDTKTLRFAARAKDDAGFLFFNNYQRLTEMNDFEDCRVQLKLKKEILTLPRKPFDVKKGAYFVWPFNLAMNDALLKYSTTQMLCKLNDKETNTYFFFGIDGIDAEYAFDSTTVQSVKTHGGKISSADGVTYISGAKPGTNCIIHIVTASGEKIDIVTLTSEQAKHCWKGQAWGRQRVFLSKANLLFGRDDLKVYSTDPEQMFFSVYPASEEELSDRLGRLPSEDDGLFTQYTMTRQYKNVKIGINASTDGVEKRDYKEWSIQVPTDLLDETSDVFLRIHYVGDTACAYINGRLAADNFYNGLPWEIGLKRFAPEILQAGLTIRITPMRNQSQIYLENWVKPPKGKESNIEKIEVLPEYSATVIQSRMPAITAKRPELSLSKE